MCQLVDISEEEIEEERKYWDEVEAAMEAKEYDNADDGDPMNGRADGCDGWD